MTQWTELDPVVRRVVLTWIERHISPRKRVNKLVHAFKLKNFLLRDTGLFISIDAMKGAMIEAEYHPVDGAQNPYYRINVREK